MYAYRVRAFVTLYEVTGTVSGHEDWLRSGVLVDDDRADIVIVRLRALRDNQEWISWLRGEKTMKFGPDEKAQTIRLIDFEYPDRNDFLASNQVWIQGIERRRPDILLYVNGIPVVDIEAKTAARGHVDWAKGAKQCARYDREIPQLYTSNCFCAWRQRTADEVRSTGVAPPVLAAVARPITAHRTTEPWIPSSSLGGVWSRSGSARSLDDHRPTRQRRDDREFRTMLTVRAVHSRRRPS